MPVDELRRRLTYGEFLEWCEFLLWEETRQTKQDLYLAQLAVEVRRSYVTKPNAVKIENFLVRTRAEQKSQESKSIWAAALGLKVDK